MLEAFTFHDKGFVVSVGARRGVADIAGITSGGQLPTCSKTPSSGQPTSHGREVGGLLVRVDGCSIRRSGTSQSPQAGRTPRCQATPM
jgi:hypothetical protein